MLPARLPHVYQLFYKRIPGDIKCNAMQRILIYSVIEGNECEVGSKINKAGDDIGQSMLWGLQ